MNNVTNINQPRNFVITSAPNEDTVKPSWGLRPGAPVPIAYTARFIFKRSGNSIELDVPYDRRELIGGTRNEREAFNQWLNKNLFNILNEQVREHDLRPSDAVQIVVFKDGIEVQLSPKKSFGYLYVGAWPTEGMIAASKDEVFIPTHMVPEGMRNPGLAKTKGKAPKEKKEFFAVVIEPGKKPEIRDIGSREDAEKIVEEWSK